MLTPERLASCRKDYDAILADGEAANPRAPPSGKRGLAAGVIEAVIEAAPQQAGSNTQLIIVICLKFSSRCPHFQGNAVSQNQGNIYGYRSSTAIASRKISILPRDQLVTIFRAVENRPKPRAGPGTEFSLILEHFP